MSSKAKNIKQRIKSLIPLFFVLIPMILITFFAKKEGRMIGIIFYMIISLYATYEVIQHNKQHFVLNYSFLLFALIFWLLPYGIWNETSTNYLFSNLNFTTYNVSSLKQLLLELLYSRENLTSLYGLFLLFSMVYVTFIFALNIKKYKSRKLFFSSWLITMFSIIYIPIAFKLLYLYNVLSLYILFAIFFIPVIVDSFGYFIGMWIGGKFIKKKFAPHISPKKTWEGAIASYLFGALCVYLLLYLGYQTNNVKLTYFTNIKQLIVGIVFLPVASIVGDLLFSAFKRLLDIKDFSNLLPGHGGIMDRFDSTSFVVLMSSTILFI